MEEDIYNPPGKLPIVALAALLMKQERWGWSKAMHEAMKRREAAALRRSRPPRRQGRAS